MKIRKLKQFTPINQRVNIAHSGGSRYEVGKESITKILWMVDERMIYIESLKKGVGAGSGVWHGVVPVDCVQEMVLASEDHASLMDEIANPSTMPLSPFPPEPTPATRVGEPGGVWVNPPTDTPDMPPGFEPVKEDKPETITETTPAPEPEKKGWRKPKGWRGKKKTNKKK